VPQGCDIYGTRRTGRSQGLHAPTACRLVEPEVSGDSRPQTNLYRCSYGAWPLVGERGVETPDATHAQPDAPAAVFFAPRRRHSVRGAPLTGIDSPRTACATVSASMAPGSCRLTTRSTWCRQQAARVELWIGDLGAVSAGELKVPRRADWNGKPKALHRRRPRGFEWLDRTPDDAAIAWTVCATVSSHQPLSADARRAAARAAVAAVAAQPEASEASWSTIPDDSDGFRVRARCLAPTSRNAEAALLTAIESVLSPPLRCSTAVAQPA
jgi:hypothetical protein